MKAAPTIKDVAMVAGVSIATVSYVINNGPRPVTEQTRHRIEVAMQQLGYEPNVSARRLRRQLTQVLGLAIAGLSGLPGLSDLYFLDLLRGVGMAADQHTYDLMLFSSPQRLQSSSFYNSLARTHMIDGLIVSGSRFNYDAVTEAEQKRLPVVVVGRQSTSSHLRHVVFSYEADAFQATAALIELGHRRIALLSNALSLSGELERLHGYRRALEAHDLPYDERLVHTPDAIWRHPTREVVADCIERAEATAFVTAPYSEVCTTLDDLGLSSDIAVATLDEEPHIPRPDRLRVGVRLGKFEAGQRAVELLLEGKKGKHDVAEVVVPSSIRRYPASATATEAP